MKRSELQFPLMEILLVLVLLLTVAAAQAPAPKEVPVTEEPSHHLLLENQYTRTYRVEVAPGKATLLHRHNHDYVFVALGEADISNEVLGKPPLEQKLKSGDVRFAPGGFAHVARNLAPTPFRNVTIEVLRKAARAAYDSSGYADNVETGDRWRTEVDTDTVKATSHELEPGGASPKIRHETDYMLVAVTNLHLKNGATGQGSSDLQLKAGDVLSVKSGGEQTLTNAGKQPARFVVVEFR